MKILELWSLVLYFLLMRTQAVVEWSGLHLEIGIFMYFITLNAPARMDHIENAEHVVGNFV